MPILLRERFLDLYFGRYEVYFLKVCLTNMIDHRKPSLDLTGFEDFFDKHSKLNLEALEASDTIEEFIGNLKGSVYYQPLANLGQCTEPYACLTMKWRWILNYFRRLWENRTVIREKQGNQGAYQSSGTAKMDMLNIQWIYRCKKYYHMTSADIYALLIPVNYQMNSRKIQEMVEADSLETLDGPHQKKLLRQTLSGIYGEDPGISVRGDSMKHILSTRIQTAYPIPSQRFILTCTTRSMKWTASLSRWKCGAVPDRPG